MFLLCVCVSSRARRRGPVNGDECYFWRTTGCHFGDKCHYKHIPEQRGKDRKPWQPWVSAFFLLSLSSPLFLNYFLFFLTQSQRKLKEITLTVWAERLLLIWMGLGPVLSYFDSLGAQQWPWWLGVGSKSYCHFQILREWWEHDSEQQAAPLKRFGCLLGFEARPGVYHLCSSFFLCQHHLSQNTTSDDQRLTNTFYVDEVKFFSNVLLCLIQDILHKNGRLKPA